MLAGSNTSGRGLVVWTIRISNMTHRPVFCFWHTAQDGLVGELMTLSTITAGAAIRLYVICTSPQKASY